MHCTRALVFGVFVVCICSSEKTLIPICTIMHDK